MKQRLLLLLLLLQLLLLSSQCCFSYNTAEACVYALITRSI